MNELLLEKSPARPTLEKFLSTKSIHLVHIRFTIDELPLLLFGS